MTTKTPLPLIPYIRRSQKKKKQQRGNSISDQRADIARWARDHNVPLADEVVEPGVSGHKPWRERGLGLALAACERGEAQGIIVSAEDRLSRENGLATAEVWDALQRADARLVCANEGLDTVVRDEEFNFSIKAAIARAEWKRHRANWLRARSNAIERGVRTAKVPFGYRRDADKRIVVDKKAARAVREVFARRAAGATLHELCTYLDGAARRPDGGAWPPSTVAGMLTTRTYIGEGEAGTRHDAIVTRAAWEAAQRKPGSVPRYVAAPRLLTGFIRCAGCGGTMTGTTDGSGYAAYRCRGRRANGVCAEQARISAKLADAYVERAFFSWLKLFDSVEVSIAETGATDGPTVDDLTTTLELAESELTAYRDESLVSVIGRAAFAAGLAKRQAAVDDARDALRSERPTGPSVIDRYQLVERWRSLSVAEKREWIRLPIERVEVSRGHVDGDERKGRSTIPLKKRVRIVWRGAEVTAEEAAERDARG